jgi:uncharacterized BrkB/YihY/UPF0761 family membrane protein
MRPFIPLVFGAVLAFLVLVYLLAAIVLLGAETAAARLRQSI